MAAIRRHLKVLKSGCLSAQTEKHTHTGQVAHNPIYTLSFGSVPFIVHLTHMHKRFNACIKIIAAL